MTPASTATFFDTADENSLSLLLLAMSDDSETVEDTEKGSLAEVTDDSCTVEFIEIVPLDRASDGYHKLEFIDPVIEVKPEYLQEIKQEPAEEYDYEDLNYSMKEESVDENENGDHNYCMKQERPDAYESNGPCFAIQVSCAYTSFYPY